MVGSFLLGTSHLPAPPSHDPTPASRANLLTRFYYSYLNSHSILSRPTHISLPPRGQGSWQARRLPSYREPSHDSTFLKSKSHILRSSANDVDDDVMLHRTLPLSPSVVVVVTLSSPMDATRSRLARTRLGLTRRLSIITLARRRRSTSWLREPRMRPSVSTSKPQL